MPLNSVEKCAGPIRNLSDLIPEGHQPIINRTNSGVECQYLQPDGICTAIGRLSPLIFSLKLRERYEINQQASEGEKRPKRVRTQLNMIDSQLARALELVKNPPVCRFINSTLV